MRLRAISGEKKEIECFLSNSNNNLDNSREHFRRFFRGRKIRSGEEHNNSRQIIRTPDANKPRIRWEELRDEDAIEYLPATEKK